MEQEELNTRFTYHRPHGDQPERYEEIRNGARLYAEIINRLVPESREKALAMTHLEDAVMWANAAIARRSY